jgi:hypothetical protein
MSDHNPQERLERELENTWAIVREFAEQPWYADDGGCYFCAHVNGPKVHTEDCLWRRAKELTS